MAVDSEDRKQAEKEAALAARREEINALAKKAYEVYGETGSSSAFDDLLKKLYAYTYSRLFYVHGFRSPDERKDAYQSIALRFWRYALSYDGKRPFLPWWNRIVVNAVSDFRDTRNRWKYEIANSDEQPIEVIGDGRRHAKRIERSAILDDILNKLSEDDRSVLHQHYRDELTAEELAREHGISVDKAKYFIRRALEHFRALYESRPAAASAPVQDSAAKGGSRDAT